MAEYNFTGLTFGSYELTAEEIYDGSVENFKECGFNVESVKIDMFSGNVYPGDENHAFIEMPDDAAGKAVLTVYAYEDEIQSQTEYDVKGSIDIVLPADLPSGFYEYSINYTGNYENYVPREIGSLYFGEDERVLPNIGAVTSDVEVGSDVVVNITVPVLARGDVSVRIVDKTYSANLTRGKASKTVSNLKAGSYDVSIDFKGM